MSKNNTRSSGKAPIPEEYWIGQELNLEAPSIPVNLYVELPFWIMVPDCLLDVEVRGHIFNVEIKDDYIEHYARAISDSRLNCVYIGPSKPDQPSKELEELIREGDITVMDRKCKTVLRIHSSCNKDVLIATGQEDRRSRSAHSYLESFCEAHLEVINHLVQHYRLSTYDFFGYEVSPWDVPIWLVGSEVGAVRVVLLNYAAWDLKPAIQSAYGSWERYKLIEENELQSAMGAEPSAGEYELLDALNLIERGDYSGAVRRIATAIEAQLESVLRQELLKIQQAIEVEKKLKASENDFPGRLRQYQKLSGRKLSSGLKEDLDTIRNLRHSIVHKGYRIPFNKREQEAQKAVDTGRWIFDWLENQPARIAVREKRIAKRSLGRHFSLFSAEI